MLLAYLVAVAQQNSLEDVAWPTRDSSATVGKNPAPKKRYAARPSLGCLCPTALQNQNIHTRRASPEQWPCWEERVF